MLERDRPLSFSADSGIVDSPTGSAVPLSRAYASNLVGQHEVLDVALGSGHAGVRAALDVEAGFADRGEHVLDRRKTHARVTDHAAAFARFVPAHFELRLDHRQQARARVEPAA